MDFSKLDQNEKLATYGSVAVILAGLVSNWGGLLFLSILAALGMLAVVFLPQLSAGTNLPGSKGTLMATLGIVAAVGAVITALQWISVIGAIIGSFGTIMFLIAIIGALVMAWAGWQELQSEGGKWVFGGTSVAASDTAASDPTQEPATTPAPDADAPVAAPEPSADETYRRADEDRSAG